MPKAMDMTGQRFGKLVVLELAAQGGGSRAGRRWRCLCDCGNERIISSGHLRDGKLSACHECGKTLRYAKAHAAKLAGMHAEDGQRFGSLRVLGPARDKEGLVRRLCACRCGSFFLVSLYQLKTGKTLSCQNCLGRTRWARYWRELRARERGSQYNQLTVVRVTAGTPTPGSNNRRGVYAVCNCACGTRGFRVLLGSLKTGNTKACGCLQHVFPEHMKGPNHPWYRHDLTDEERTAMRVFEGQDAFRSSIFRRDDYTCQACGQRGGRLAAHHIKPWAYFRNHRFTKKNLVTLCKCCHDSFHSDFGRQNPDIWRHMVPWIRERREETGYKHPNHI